MAVLPFVMWPDKRLRSKAAEVPEITDEIRTIWDDMIETMDAMPGLGLAAPQIGILKALAVADVTPGRNRRIRLANPVLIDASPETQSTHEGSPNLPGLSAPISRAKRITVRFLNEEGVIDRRDFKDLEARSVLHQMDHLEGRMYFDNLGPVKRDMLLRKYRKTRR